MKYCYFDYNSTAPTARRVLDWLGENGREFSANPSSLHSRGQRARQLVTETRDFLFNFFQLSKNEYDLFFHSGATEGINTILKSKRGEKIELMIAPTDHAAVRAVGAVGIVSAVSGDAQYIPIDQNGMIELGEMEKKLATNTQRGITTLINYTYVNNELGVYWPLEWAARWKEKKELANCLIHVDGVQAIFKIPDANKLNNKLDYYTFSGHKFGALKGIGFSLVKRGAPLTPLLVGGGQESGLRAGTENVEAIYSLKLALEELINNLDLEQTYAAKKIIEDRMAQLNVKIVARNSSHRNSNTIMLIINNPKVRADMAVAAFDLQNMAISAGSACSAGSLEPNPVLLALGVSREEALRGIRLSFSPTMKVVEAKEYAERVAEVLNRLG